MWRDLQPIGRDSRTGGYVRSPFRSAERECAAWYAEQAAARGLELEFDGQDNAVAWWNAEPSESSDPQADKGILIGSHLDSVDLGGAFDGPLGVVSSFAAIDRLRDAGVRPKRPVGVAMFIEEEGSRFGVACLGSRLATGLMTPEQARELRDTDGVALLDAMSAAGLEPKLGRSAWLDQVELFVELHVEQGRDLVHRDTAVGVASASWAHGRWRFDFTGEPNHAGATAMDDRHDPMLTYAMTALAANKQARLSDTRATFGADRRRAEHHQRDPLPRLGLARRPRRRRRVGPARRRHHQHAGRRPREPGRHDRGRHRRVRRRPPSTSTRRWADADLPHPRRRAGHPDRRRPRRRDPPARRHPVGDALRPQPDRSLALAGRSTPRQADCLAGVDALTPACSTELVA